MLSKEELIREFLKLIVFASIFWGNASYAQELEQLNLDSIKSFSTLHVRDSFLYEYRIAAYSPYGSTLKRGGFIFATGLPNDTVYAKSYVILSRYYISLMAKKFPALNPDLERISECEETLHMTGSSNGIFDSSKLVNFGSHNYYLPVKIDAILLDIGIQDQLIPNMTDPAEYVTEGKRIRMHCFIVYKINSLQ